MQTDIAKYAMWLFDTAEPREELPDLYDHLCQKNPVRGDTLTFGEFEELYHEWRLQRLNDIGEGAGPALAKPTTTPVATDSVTQKPQAPTSLPPATSNYHVVTEFLIEQLIEVVNQYVAEGWHPLGGVCRAALGSGLSYWAQALVRVDAEQDADEALAA